MYTCSPLARIVWHSEEGSASV